jgi:hypothetical protein
VFVLPCAARHSEARGPRWFGNCGASEVDRGLHYFIEGPTTLKRQIARDARNRFREKGFPDFLVRLENCIIVFGTTSVANQGIAKKLLLNLGHNDSI